MAARGWGTAAPSFFGSYGMWFAWHMGLSESERRVDCVVDQHGSWQIIFRSWLMFAVAFGASSFGDSFLQMFAVLGRFSAL